MHSSAAFAYYAPFNAMYLIQHSRHTHVCMRKYRVKSQREWEWKSESKSGVVVADAAELVHAYDGSHSTRIILIMIIMNAELVVCCVCMHACIHFIMMQSRSKLINYEIINRFCCNNNNNPTFISFIKRNFLRIKVLAACTHKERRVW